MAASSTRNDRVGRSPGSPLKQSSPLRQSPVIDKAIEEEDDELFASSTSNTLDSLRKQHAKMSLTGDKAIKESPKSSPLRPGAWNMKRHRAISDHSRDDSSPSAADKAVSRSSASSTSDAARTKPTPPSSPSRFSFFSMTAKKIAAASPVVAPNTEELVNLDIVSALFPAGAPNDKEPPSPTSFKNLHNNAMNLLRQYQLAYRETTIACKELKAERDAQLEEKMESETRTAHLKVQLEDMARKASEAEAMMQALVEDLKRERQLRAEERANREAGIMSSGMSTISEDLGVEDDQRKKYRRRSGGTTKSDDPFDTDDESIDQASVFSRSRSPTLAASAPELATCLESVSRQSSLAPSVLPPIAETTTSGLNQINRQSQSQGPALQKLMKGNQGESQGKDNGLHATYGCENCQGQDASVAWDTAGLLRDENRGLKHRVTELESAVDRALDAVMGVNQVIS